MKTFAFIFALSLSTLCNGQGNKLDSLYQALDNHSAEDTVRVRLMYQIARYEFFKNQEKALTMATEAAAMARKINYGRGLVISYRLLSTVYNSRGEVDSVVHYCLKIIDACEKFGITDVGTAHSQLGNIHMELKEYDESEVYFKYALVLAKKIENRRPGNYIGTSMCYYNLGELFLRMEKFDSALVYYKMGLELNLKMNDIRGTSMIYSGLANASMRKGDSESAIGYYTNALALLRKFSSKHTATSAHSDLPDVSSIYSGLARAYTKTGLRSKGTLYADSSLIFAKQSRDKKKLRDSYEVLSEIEKSKLNYAAALRYHELSAVYRDSVFSEEKRKQVNELEARYRTQRKIQEIQILQRDNSIKTLWNNIAFAASGVILLAAVVAISMFRYREKKNRELFNARIDFLLAENQDLSLKYKFAAIDATNDTLESQDQRLLKKTLEIVEKNISDPLFGVENLADELSMSRDSLHRKLKAVTGFPPSDLIRSLRLKRAAAMLRNQSDSVSQIGFLVGFRDQSYFSKSFKKQFGVSPTDFVRSETLSS